MTTTTNGQEEWYEMVSSGFIKWLYCGPPLPHKQQELKKKEKESKKESRNIKRKASKQKKVNNKWLNKVSNKMDNFISEMSFDCLKWLKDKSCVWQAIHLLVSTFSLYVYWKHTHKKKNVKQKENLEQQRWISIWSDGQAMLWHDRFWVFFCWHLLTLIINCYASPSGFRVFFWFNSFMFFYYFTLDNLKPGWKWSHNDDD